MEAAGDASSLLWWASTDNHCNGYINPSFVIEARQRVQEMITAAGWRFIDLAAREHVDVLACRQQALEAGSRVMMVARWVLAQGKLPPVALSHRSEQPYGPLEAPRMPQDRRH